MDIKDISDELLAKLIDGNLQEHQMNEILDSLSLSEVESLSVDADHSQTKEDEADVRLRKYEPMPACGFLGEKDDDE